MSLKKYHHFGDVKPYISLKVSSFWGCETMYVSQKVSFWGCETIYVSQKVLSFWGCETTCLSKSIVILGM